ncbi:MAG TPA: response regulator transcription factor [Acidobacteriota bacterium]|jgi:two-component system, NarL family, invasion response regulator UvrY|nr:response regulator transcription factor [Acidobacteriota bacterium]
MIRILIADDHVLIREGLKKIIKEDSLMEVAAEAQDAREIFERLKQGKIDIVVLDLSLPGKNGLEILKDLKEQNPNLPVLILSMHPEDRFAVRALKAGASGYLTKESAAQELIKAIRHIVQGRKYVSPTLAENLALYLQEGTERPPHETLSDREYQILCLIAGGKTMKEIAQRLFLSISTVNTYRSRVLSKMNMKNDADLIRYAVQNRLVD